jgi:hypothetical protein
MTEKEIQEITHALERWANEHPEPDKPVLSIAGNSYSPKQLAYEVYQQTPVGILQLRVFQHALDTHEETVEGILNGLLSNEFSE